MISIIIPAHNEALHLKKLLPYLFTRVIENGQAEVIVAISPATTDGSDSGFSNPALQFLHCKKQGRAAQMNEGAKAARGDIFVFLHADVWPPESFVGDIETTLKNGFDAGFFSYRFNKSSLLLNTNASFTRKDGIFTGGGDQCLFIRKKVFQGLGMFDEKQVLMEDFELFRRMKKAGVTYKIVKNDLLVSARKYETNSYLRVNLTNLLLVILFKLGISSETLKKLHNRLLRMPYNLNKDAR
jgi:rSAM/selenodomain-associated transferase 2